ncbi:hypothetical protein [Streptomyces liangshanensis]|uniref:hypothetical protein n=1 Tax=Streptomyces liangshanensis TaxID=2717324 RepID=UPI0036D9881F
MDLGDAPGWGALVLSAGALAVAWKARGDGKRSADAAQASVGEAQRSAAAAEASVVEGRRSADAAEGALAEQRREAEERREAEAEANRPRVRLEIAHRHGATYQLINNGSATAVNVRVVGPRPRIQNRIPDGVTLEPNEIHDFMMSHMAGSPIPSTLRMQWDGQDEPVPLRVPSRL